MHDFTHRWRRNIHICIMLQNSLSYDTPNCGNAIPEIVKRQVSNIVKEEACLQSHYSRLLPEYYLGLAHTPRTIKREKHRALEAKELSVFCSNQSSILHFKYFYMEKRSDSREFLLPVLAQAYFTAESWPLDKTSVEVRCRLVF